MAISLVEWNNNRKNFTKQITNNSAHHQIESAVWWLMTQCGKTTILLSLEKNFVKMIYNLISSWKIWFDGSFANDLKCESKIKQIFYTVDDEFEFLVKWDCCAKTQSHNLLTCQSFDPWSFEKSWGRISTIIFKLIVLDDVLVADGVPTDSNADVGGHLWFHGRKSLNATKSEPPTNSYKAK